jgi:DNA invertase Pin-like site-specific DNA recombinase
MRIGYARVSTKSQNLDLQLDALTAANCKKIYKEKISGTANDRPELVKCLKILQPGDHLVVWKLDRLGRSLKELVNTVSNLADKEVVLLSLSENINTSSTTGRIVFHIFAMMAEYEKDLIRERVLAAREAARTRGTPFGRPTKLGADDWAEVAHLRASGLSMTRVAALKGVSRTTLYRHWSVWNTAENDSCLF